MDAIKEGMLASAKAAEAAARIGERLFCQNTPNVMNFNSQICTSREQSERLLALGLKKKTADCCYYYYDGEYLIAFAEDAKYPSDIPAWSLHRLIEMMPRCIKCRNGYDYADLYVNFDLVQYRFYDTDYMHDVCYEHFNDGDVYSNVIDCIEWLIKEGYFNKEYLV